MSNLGLQRAAEQDIRLVRMPVGVRSGHAIFREWATTADCAARLDDLAAELEANREKRLDELPAV